MPRLPVILLVILLWAAAASAQEPAARIIGDVASPGRFVPLLVNPNGSGLHELSGEAMATVRWSGSGPRIIPVLIWRQPGANWQLLLDQQPITVSVPATASPRPRVLDVGAGWSVEEWASLWPEAAESPERYRLEPSPFAAAHGIAWEGFDAVGMSEAPSEELLQILVAAGVRVVAGQRVLPAVKSPDLTSIMPSAFAPTTGWNPRPARGSLFIALGCLVAYVLATLLVLRTRRWGVGISLLSILMIGGILLWAWLRPTLAVRTVELAVGDASLPLMDRWIFVAAPVAPAEARFAIVGLTRPVFFSPGHAEQLDPVLDLDEATWTLHLPEGTTAVVLQRMPGVAESEDDPWARRLREALYDRP